LNVIENYLEKHSGEFLFDMTTTNMTMALKRLTKKIYGVDFSVDIIRHAFITDLYDNTNISPAEKQEILTLFGHSVSTTQTDKYYRKT
jgi:integrase